MPMREAEIQDRYPVKVTEYFAGLIRRSDPNDPIALQVMQSAREMTAGEMEKTDPLDEKLHMPVPGLIHKYPGRVLLILTNKCAVNCRFCFRKYLHGTDGNCLITSGKFDPQLRDYLQRKTDIREIILSGGDPLILTDDQIRETVDEICRIPHIDLLRIHTRIPGVLPSRITSDLVKILKNHSAVWLVAHFNHPNELTAASESAVRKFVDHGIPVMSQTVLLKRINNSFPVLKDLFLKLVTWRVKPYYLHMLDPAPGTAHFRVSDQEAKSLIQQLRQSLPGYAVPRLVRDIPGCPGKMELI